MSHASDFHALVRAAVAVGCKLLGGGAHEKLVTPNGTRLTVSRSPSDVNAVNQLRRELRRAGVTV